MSSLRPNIFISYRRADTAPFVGRLYGHLKANWRLGYIFRDVHSIVPSANFIAAIREGVIKSDVVLVMIGKQWATIQDPTTGQPRLFIPGDLVCYEVEMALQHNKRVIPVLVDGATMPAPNQVPTSIQPLLYKNAVKLRDDPDFEGDAKRLMKTLVRWASWMPLIFFLFGCSGLTLLFGSQLNNSPSRVLTPTATQASTQTVSLNTTTELTQVDSVITVPTPTLSSLASSSPSQVLPISTPAEDTTILTGTEIGISVLVENSTSLYIRANQNVSVKEVRLQLPPNQTEVISPLILNDKFDMLAFTDGILQQGVCLSIYSDPNNIPPLSNSCDKGKSQSKPISPSDVFWYDRGTNVYRAFGVYQGSTLLGICTASQGQVCNF
jgi:hypothetical protein